MTKQQSAGTADAAFVPGVDEVPAGRRRRWRACVGALAMLAVASTPALADPPPPDFEGLMEWVGTGEWSGNKWSEYGELELMGPRGTQALGSGAEAPPAGVQPIFAGRGSEETIVDQLLAGENHWEIFSLAFDDFREWDDDEGVFDVEDAPQYTISGNALYLGAGGITNASSTTHIIENDIWLWDDTTINGGGSGLELHGGVIDTSRGKQAGEVKNLTATGTIENWARIIGGGDVTFEDGFSLVQHADITGGNVTFEDGSAEINADIFGDGDVVISDTTFHMHGAIRGDTDLTINAGAEVHLHEASTYTGQTTIEQTDPGLENTVVVFVGDERAFGETDGSIRVIGSMMLGSYSEDLVIDYDFRVQDGPDGPGTGRIRFGVADDNPLVQMSGIVDLDNSDTTLFMEHGAEARFLTGSEIRLGDATLTIDGLGDSVIRVDGRIRGGQAGQDGLIYDSLGTLVLTGQNDYQGHTRLQEGDVRFAGDLAFGGSEDLFLEDGLSSLGSAVGEAPASTGINVHLDTNLDLVPDGVLRFDGDWQVLTAARRLTVVTDPSDGHVLFSETSSIDLNNLGLTLAGVGTTIIDGTIVGDGTLIKSGSGTLRLTNENSYDGETLLRGGRLEIAEGALGVGDWLRVENAASLVALEELSIAQSVDLQANFTIAQGAAITFAGDDMTVDDDIVLTLNSTQATTVQSTLALDNMLTIQGNGDLTLDGQVTGDEGIVHRGAGILTLSAANDYLGDTQLFSGTTRVGDDAALGLGRLRIQDQADLGADNAVTLGNDVDIAGHLRLIQGESIDFAGTVTAVSGVGPQITVANAAGSGIAAGGELVLNDHLTLNIAGVAEFTILGDITGTRNLVSVGPGTLSIGGAPKSYAESIIQAGRFHVLDNADVTTTALRVSSSAVAQVMDDAALTASDLVSLSDSAVLRLDEAALLTADRIELNDASLLEIGVDAHADVATTADVMDQSILRLLAGATMDVDEITVNSGTLRLDAGSTLTPQEPLTLTGGGTARLAGSVDGVIAVNQGTLQFDGDGGLANTTQVNIDGPTSMLASTAVNVDGPSTLRLRNTLTLANGAALTLDGPELLVDQAATLAVSNAAATALGPNTVVTLDNPLTVQLNQDLDVHGSFMGAANLTLAGPGTLRVHSNTSSIGDAFLNEGTLHLPAGGGIDMNNLAINGGALQLDAGASVAPQGPLVLSTGGTLMLAGSVDGVIQVNRGTLRLDADAALADTTDLHINGPTTMFASTAVTIDSATALRLRDTLTLADGAALTLDGPSMLVDQPATLVNDNAAATTLGPDTTVTLTQTLTFDLNEDLDVEGRLTGAAGFIKTGPGTLRIHSDDSDPAQATIAQGLVHLPAGAALNVDELNLTGGSVQLDPGSNLAITSETRITGGRLDLTPGATFSSDHVIVEQGGVLQGPGSVQAPVTVANGGELRVAADDGQAFTTLEIDGDLTLAGGSRTIIRFDSTGSTDSVAVAGDSVIAAGARLILDQTDDPDLLTPGLRLPVMTANSFDVDPEAIELDIELTRLLRVSLQLEDNPTLAVVTSQDLFAFSAVDGNNRRIAEVLDEIAGQQEALAPEDRDEAMEALLAELDPQNLTDDAFNAALEAISPVFYTGIAQSQLQGFRAFHADVHRAARLAQQGREQFAMAEMPADAPRLAQGFDQRGWSDRYRTDQAPAMDVPQTVPEQRISAFVTGHGVYDRLASQDDRPGLRSNSHGFIVGGDYALSHELSLGVSAGYTRSSLRFRSGRGSGRIHTVRVGPYATYEDERLTLDASLSYGYHDTRINSDSSVGNVNESKRATYDAQDISAHVSASYGFDTLDEQLTISPLVALDYTWYHRDAFSESGTNTASSVRVDSDSTQALQSTLGLGLSLPAHHARPLQPEAFVGWSFEFLDDRPEARAQFVGHDPRFTVRGPRADRHGLVVGAGLAAHWSETISTYAFYNGRFQSNESTQAITAGLTWRF